MGAHSLVGKIVKCFSLERLASFLSAQKYLVGNKNTLITDNITKKMWGMASSSAKIKTSLFRKKSLK